MRKTLQTRNVSVGTCMCAQCLGKTWNVYYRQELDAHMQVPLFLWNKLQEVCIFGTFCFLWFGFIKYLVKNQ